MKHALFLMACICTPCVAQELPKAKPGVQAQIQKTFDTMSRYGVVDFSNVEVFQEAQRVEELASDEEEAVRQLAVYVATTESVEDSHAIIALSVWRYLNVSPKVTIRVLAPYLDSGNRALRGFVRDWFQGHDNFEDYGDYIRRQKDVPAPFIDFIFERLPGGALLAIQKGSVDVRKQIEIVQQRRSLTEEEREERDRQQQERREVLLAEHIISNALWLHKNEFDERFQEALPEAMAELEKLAKHKQWWARMYVVYIMRQNPVLLQDHILRQLTKDENALVRNAAKGLQARPAPNPGDGRPVEPRAPDNVQSRALGPTSAEVMWDASVGATSYTVQRRQPDTDTEFTTIAPNVTGTSYTDSGLAKDTLYEYRVIAHQNP